MTDPTAQGDSKQKNEAGCLARLFWMLIGNAALFGSAYFILDNRGGSWSTADWFFGGTVVLLIAVRYLDITHLDGETALGKPATMAHWWRYVIVLLAAALAVWCVAHSAAWFGV